MAIEAQIDVELLRQEVRKTYAAVSLEPEEERIFPTGRRWAEDLDYPDELANVPDTALDSYAGVANPFSLGRLDPGEQVLDLGCGAGTDTLVAAQMVAPAGRAVGIDLTPEMLARARSAAAAMEQANVEFIEGDAEHLPFADECFDVIISNGVIDLIPDKDAVFAELMRVLQPGGRIQIADVTIQRPCSLTGIAGALLEAEYGERLAEHGFERIESGDLVATYAGSAFEDTRRKAAGFGAHGTTVKAYKPRRA